MASNAVLFNSGWTPFKLLDLKVSRNEDVRDSGSVPQGNVLLRKLHFSEVLTPTMASGVVVMHQSQATTVFMHSLGYWDSSFFFSRFLLYLCLFFSQKINSLFYKLPWQPYISTLIDICPFHSTGRKRTYRALIGGFKWWKTGVFWSVFPENSYSENSSVNLSGCRWFIGCSSWRKALDKSLSSW